MIFKKLSTTSLFWSIVGQRVRLILILFLAMPLCMAQGVGSFCGNIVDANGPKLAFSITDNPPWRTGIGVIGYEFKKDKGKICVQSEPKPKNGKENYIVVITPNGELKTITPSACYEMDSCISPPPPVATSKTGIRKWLEKVREKEQTVVPGVTQRSGLPPLPKMLVPSGSGIRLVQGKPTLHLFLGECQGKNCGRNVGICKKVNTETDCNKGQQGIAVDQNGIISLKLQPKFLQANQTYSVGINGKTVVDLTVLDKLPSSETELPSPKSLHDVDSQGCKIAQLGSTPGWNLEAYQQIVKKIETVNQDQKLKVFSGILEKVKNALQYPDKYELGELNSVCATK